MAGLMILMGCLCLPIMVLAADATEDVAINETNFPDANFRAYVKNTVAGGSDSLRANMIDNTLVMNLAGKEISDLTGIANFTSLQELYLGGGYDKNSQTWKNNKLTTLDLSHNND